MPMKRVNVMLSEDVIRYLDQQAEALGPAAGKAAATRSMLIRVIVGGLADARAAFGGPADEKSLRRSVGQVVSEALALHKRSTPPHHR